MAYVDGFVLPLPKKNLAVYRNMARKAGKIWMEYGALQFRECLGDDLNVDTSMMMPFPVSLKLKPGETVVFSYIVFKSRAHRDKVNALVMKDKRMMKICPEVMPFDTKRMRYGGFKTIVDL